MSKIDITMFFCRVPGSGGLFCYHTNNIYFDIFKAFEIDKDCIALEFHFHKDGENTVLYGGDNEYIKSTTNKGLFIKNPNRNLYLLNNVKYDYKIIPLDKFIPDFKDDTEYRFDLWQHFPR